MKAAAGASSASRPVLLGPARLAMGMLLVVILGLGVGFGVHQLAAGGASKTAIVSTRFGMHGEVAWAAGTRPAPAIDTLRDQTGRRFSLATLRGQAVALVFFDSHCRQQCPLEGRALAAADSSVPAAVRPVVVAVSVNLADTRASVTRAMHAWGLAHAGRWYWLMGTRAHLASVWRAYHIYVAPKPVGGDIQHTEAVYLIDRRGFERSAYLYPFGVGFVAHDLRVLG